jgi:tetratricopeptide (TPR) repeat protein
MQVIYSRIARWKFLFLTVSFLAISTLYGQDCRDSYLKAADLRKEAKKLEDKQPGEADDLYEKANVIYPGMCPLFGGAGLSKAGGGLIDRLSILRMENGDINGAHKAIEAVIRRIEKMDGGICEVEDYDLLGRVSKVGKKAKQELLMQWYIYRADLNLYYGDRSYVKNDILKIIEIGFDKKEYKKQGSAWNLSPVTINFLMTGSQINAFQSADLEFLKKLQPAFKMGEDDEYYELGEAYIAYHEGRVDEAIKRIGSLKNKVQSDYLLTMIYAMEGDVDMSEKYLKKLKVPKLFDMCMTARVELIKKNFARTIELTNEILKPVIKIGGTRMVMADKFLYYYLRAEAFKGVKEYDKARKDYEASLIFNSDFQPAFNGLASLEGELVQVRRIDKDAPQIQITEPSIQRGLSPKVNDQELLIKGRAIDPGGLKSVSINGQLIYSKESGEFWTSVTLKPGPNRLVIAAEDFSGNTGEEIVEIEHVNTALPRELQEFEGKNYALLIASQNYDDSRITSLNKPITDAVKLKLLLQDGYNFQKENIFMLLNPTIKDFKKQFIELSEILEPNDNLVIFYAGHGVWVEKEKKGYWLLTDAASTDPNTWLPNKEVLDWISRLKSRHTLLITDACFSGSVFKTRAFDPNAPSVIQQMQRKISRVAITSGNDTEVPDESVFMKFLIKALSENKEKYLTAQKMFINHIIEAVMKESKIEPRYGTLEMAGHVGGDFIFIKK